MIGFHHKSAKRLTDFEHLKQSIFVILNTPKKSRVMRRDFGSRLHELVDAPTNKITIAKAMNYVAEALDQYEPRIFIEKIKVSFLEDIKHHFLIEIEAKYKNENIKFGVNV